MPGLVRKLIVFAAVDGLILQAHGAVEHHNALKIDYKSRGVRALTASDSVLKADSSPRLEVHGIIGLLSIASYSYLISITQREQVAQIFGKPVFVITDVAFTPLTSQVEANKAITEAIAAQKKGDPIDHDTDSSDESDVEPAHEPQTPADPIDSSPAHDDERPLQERSSSGTSIVQDVISNRAQYGKVASQWFSRKAWAQGKVAPTASSTSETQQPSSVTPAGRNQHLEPAGKRSETEAGDVAVKGSSQEAAVALIPKILKNTRLILTSRSFFFSYDTDLTHRMGTRTLEQLSYNSTAKPVPDPRYFWNKNLATEFTSSQKVSFLLPIMQGFVGQRSFVIKREHKHTRAVELLEAAGTRNAASSEDGPSPANCSQTFLLTLVSRRSTQRSGLRYLRRGIDDNGSCANSVETEQILSSPTWEDIKVRAFCQFRGSIPLYFSQTPYAFKPVPVLHQSSNKNQAAMRKHFEALQQEYGGVQSALLVDKHGPEVKIGEAYEAGVKELNETLNPPVDIHWFDFHAECRGMKFENVDRLVKILEDKIETFGETVLEKGVPQQTQKGIIRTNCMDCLDRTNVAQSAFGQYVLQRDLAGEGFEIDLLHDEATQWFNSLWADNGDAISRQYAGTAALKGDFTRTRKRNYRGALNDLGLTLNRYYNNMVNDFFSQAVIDLLVGNVTSKVFEDFENDMMSADPGVSLSGARDAAIESCTRIVIQDEDEDLVQGWTLLSPSQPNTLRTLPFEEAVVLLSDAAIYSVKFDWNTQKVSSFEKIDLRSITKIQYGTYITSTLSERQTVEALNVGLVIQYNPGKNSVMRVNTRSLQNVVSNEQVPEGVDGGTGLMSWVASRTSGHSDNNSRIMALKVIPAESGLTKPSDAPLAVAERICDEIRRAVTSSTDNGEQIGLEMVEKGDIISLVEARKRTGYLEQLGHSIKKMVWT